MPLRWNCLLLTAAAFLPLFCFGQVQVTIFPTSASPHAGTRTVDFTRTITGTNLDQVTWSLQTPAGQQGSPGSLDNRGRYTPPNAIPVPNTVTVVATSVADPSQKAFASITILHPYPTVASASPVRLPIGAFTISVNGAGFVRGATVLLGAQPFATTFVSANRLTAQGTTTSNQNGSKLSIAVMNPNPGSFTSVEPVRVTVGPEGGANAVAANVAARFLEQAAFGPDEDTAAHVRNVGLQGYLAEQFSAPISPYQNPDTIYGNKQVQARFFTNAVHGEDQLRQRVVFALSQIFVVSAVELNAPAELVPFPEILQRGAFGNYLTLMTEVTLSPSMGLYLNMVDNDIANAARGTLPNENYARELLQLFTVGTSMLNADGTVQRDATGNPVPTYAESTVIGLARVFTGWTYPLKPGAVPQKHNPQYFAGPMIAFESNHDENAKTVLGSIIPPGQTAFADLTAALSIIFNHPNVGPFVSKNLIQHLVTSNPSPAYVGRVAAAFNNNGAGVRGDLKAVVQAILLDPEARQGDSSASPTEGHLREPILLAVSALRGLGASVNDSNTLAPLIAPLGQNVFFPPSVFNYYAPNYMVPASLTAGGPALLGPEFQLHSPSSALGRADLINTFLYSKTGAGYGVDLTPFASLAGTPQLLLDKINSVFFRGQMPAAMQQHILTAINGTPGSIERARAALYVALTSGYYSAQN